MYRHFNHEGTRRRSWFSHVEQEWKDTTCLAILDTDWVMRDYFKAAPMSLWDELFLRHEKEREKLLKWEDGILDAQRRLLRSSSTETIRYTVIDSSPSNNETESESESDSNSPDIYVAKLPATSNFDSRPGLHSIDSDTYVAVSMDKGKRKHEPPEYDYSDYGEESDVGSFDMDSDDGGQHTASLKFRKIEMGETLAEAYQSPRSRISTSSFSRSPVGSTSPTASEHSTTSSASSVPMSDFSDVSAGNSSASEWDLLEYVAHFTSILTLILT